MWGGRFDFFFRSWVGSVGRVGLWGVFTMGWAMEVRGGRGCFLFPSGKWFVFSVFVFCE